MDRQEGYRIKQKHQGQAGDFCKTNTSQADRRTWNDGHVDRKPNTCFPSVPNFPDAERGRSCFPSVPNFPDAQRGLERNASKGKK